MRKISAVILLGILQITVIACGMALNRFVLHGQNMATTYHAIMGCAALLTVPGYFYVIRPRLLQIPTPVPAYRQLVSAGVITVLVMASLATLFIGAENAVRLAWWRVTPQLVLIALAISVYVPLLEEILFRDMLLRWSLPYLGWGKAVILQGLLFSGFHFFSYVFYWHTAISLALSGVLFALVWLYTKNIYFPILVHAALNFFLHVFNGVDSAQGRQPGIIVGEGSGWQFYFIIGYKLLACMVLFTLLHKHHKAAAITQ
jgi:membrane protease YdiL (CAAX protease family)